MARVREEGRLRARRGECLARLFGGVAEDTLDRRALVNERAGGVDDGDRVGAMLDEGAEAFLAGTERSFGGVALGAVFGKLVRDVDRGEERDCESRRQVDVD